MIVPNKIISIDESIVLKAGKLFSTLDETSDVLDLYFMNKRLFVDISDYIEALDVLFALDKIDLDPIKGVIKIA
ncbi:ABC-three component system middle component 7 [Vibrio harveyi]|uniref:ABC-three component system middle component 7 n=1 Tax=Vibrio harveyi TaxID=669 RepID=UPI0038CDC473